MARIRSVQQLRQGLGDAASDYTDEELVQAWATATGRPLPGMAAKMGLDTPSGPWGEQASAAIDAYQAGMLGLTEAVGGAAGMEGLQDWASRRRRANEIRAAISGQRAAEGGIPQSYRDVEGIGSGLRYIGGLGIQSAPYLAEAAAGGLGARAVFGGAKAALAGGVAASYPSAVADILQSQRDQAGETDLGTAAALGVPYAALNAMPGLESIAATGRVARTGLRALDEVQGLRGAAARLGASAAFTGASEGLSETGQEVVNQLGRMSVDPNVGLADPEALERYKESFIGGALLGGTVAGGLGGWRRSSPMAAPLPSIDEPAAPPPSDPVDILQLGFSPLAGTPVVFPDGTVALGSEAAADYRYAPQATDMMPYGPASPFEEGGLPRLGFSPLAGVPIVHPDGTISLPGELEQPAAEGGSFDALAQAALEPAPGGLSLQAYEEGPYFTPPSDQELGGFDTGDLTYEGQFSDVSFPAAGLSGEMAADVRQPAADVPALDFAGGPEAAPLAAAQRRAEGRPATPEGARQLALTQERRTRAEEALGRAREAGMQSEKQQEAFWRAEELAAEGKLSESKMTQAIALLLQGKHGRVNKILDEAAAAPVPAPQVAADVTTGVEEVEIAPLQRAPAQVAAAAPAVVSPTMEPAAPSAPTTLAQRVKETREKAQKLKRYETLLACLQRATK